MISDGSPSSFLNDRDEIIYIHYDNLEPTDFFEKGKFYVRFDDILIPAITYTVVTTDNVGERNFRGCIYNVQKYPRS